MLGKGLAAWGAPARAQHCWAPARNALEGGWRVPHAKTPQPFMNPVSQAGLQPRGHRQSVLLAPNDSSGAATVSPQLLSLPDPSEQRWQGIRAKNEQTLEFSAARSPPARSLQQLLVHRCLSFTCSPCAGKGSEHQTGHRDICGSRKNTGRKGSTPNCQGLKS